MGRSPIGRRAMTNAQRQRRWRKAHKVRKGSSGRPLMDRDYYPTREPKAVEALSGHLPKNFRFIEPCAGQGHLIDNLVGIGGTCAYACDIEPKRDDIVRRDALTLNRADVPRDCLILTNPPSSRVSTVLLHKMIVRFSDIGPTWLMLPVGWLCNQGSRSYLDRLRLIVPVGFRLQWYDGDGSERRDFVWLKFTKPSKEPPAFLWTPST